MWRLSFLSSFMDLLCHVTNKIMYVLSWQTVSVLTQVLFWCLFPSLLRNWGNKHQNNPLVSTETFCHLSTYIILYLLMTAAWQHQAAPCQCWLIVNVLQEQTLVKFENQKTQIVFQENRSENVCPQTSALWPCPQHMSYVTIHQIVPAAGFIPLSVSVSAINER